MRAGIVLLLMLLFTGAARAEVKGDKNAARPHVQAADIAYKLGKFEEALASYSKAYEVYPAPALLFNLGQCHRNLKQWERAVFFYEGFLRESPANAPNRKLVEDLLKETRVELARENALDAEARKALEAAREKAAIEAARIKAANDAAIEAERAKQQREAEARREQLALEEKRRRDEEARRPVYKKWWFWTAVGGVAAASAGAYYLSGDTTFVAPSGSLGGLDRR
jgi:tetratricopeptide (TPR) repeat protein